MPISLCRMGSEHPEFTTMGGLAVARPDKWTVTLSLSLHLQGGEERAAFQLFPTQTFPQIKGSFHHCVLIRGKRSAKLTAGQHQTSNATPLYSRGFKLGFELRPCTELHMTDAVLYKIHQQVSHKMHNLFL